MADTQIDIPGVGMVAFPDSMTEAQINAASTRLYQNANVGKKQPPVTSWTGLTTTGVWKAVPAARTAAEEVFTNPEFPQMAAKVGRVAGGIVPTAVAAYEGSPWGATAALAASGKTSWAGGKMGYFTGKTLQGATEPIAKTLAAVAPYAQALTTIGGAQSALDLAKMVPGEQGRKDIGVLGMGTGDPGDPDHPALLNLLAGKVSDAVKYLVSMGIPQGEATRAVMNARVKNGSK